MESDQMRDIETRLLVSRAWVSKNIDCVEGSIAYWMEHYYWDMKLLLDKIQELKLG